MKASAGVLTLALYSVLGLWLNVAGTAAAQGGATRLQLQPEHRATTPGEQRCLDAFRAETTRIERDLGGRAPSKHDGAAYQAWALDLHRQLQQAGDRAEACSRTARAPFAAAAASAAEACAARARQAIAAVERRYAGRTLNSAEQTARRTEETRVLDERHGCAVAAMRP